MGDVPSEAILNKYLSLIHYIWEDRQQFHSTPNKSNKILYEIRAILDVSAAASYVVKHLVNKYCPLLKPSNATPEGPIRRTPSAQTHEV